MFVYSLRNGGCLMQVSNVGIIGIVADIDATKGWAHGGVSRHLHIIMWHLCQASIVDPSSNLIHDPSLSFFSVAFNVGRKIICTNFVHLNAQMTETV